MSTLIQDAKNAVATDALKKVAIQCLDYTSLNDTDTDDDVRTLCERAMTPMGNVAAICIFPDFVDFAKRTLVDPEIKIATVVNFPTGAEKIDRVLAVTRSVIFDGADEIDVVLPYSAYLAGEREACIDFLKAVKTACGDKVLKVILETGELADVKMIRQASDDAISAGADFLKTSTGKVKIGATLEAAEQMLNACRDHFEKTGKTVGFKASGGIRTKQDAVQYITLARSIMGENWVTPTTFRLGASSLLANLLGEVGSKTGY